MCDFSMCCYANVAVLCSTCTRAQAACTSLSKHENANNSSRFLQLDVENDVLALSVDRKEAKEEKTEEEGVTWHHTERSHFFLKRSLRLPDTADMDNAAASYKDGVLTVTVPKTKEAVTKKRVAIS